MHRFTVDRHLVETCIEASRLIRRVARPDVLMAAALLHDIGKGQLVDHSRRGGAAGRRPRRPGWASTRARSRLVADLVRWHLLLAEVATTRDLEDPATVAYVAERVPDPRRSTCSRCSPRPTRGPPRRRRGRRGGRAWSPTCAGGCGRALSDAAGRRPARPRRRSGREVEVLRRPCARTRGGSTYASTARRTAPRVTVVSGDRVGLIADVAGALAVLRISVRSARAWTQDDLAVSVWDVDDTHLDEAIAAAAPRGGRRRPAGPGVPAAAAAATGARAVGAGPPRRVGREATVLEVRVDDRPGVVYLVCAALARLDLSVRSAHLATLGPQAVDVFYVQEPRRRGAERRAGRRRRCTRSGAALPGPGYP